jgi:hypothetical protein
MSRDAHLTRMAQRHFMGNTDTKLPDTSYPKSKPYGNKGGHGNDENISLHPMKLKAWSEWQWKDRKA